MNYSDVDFNINGSKLLPSGGYTRNKVLIMVRTNFNEILENPRTGHQTLTARFDSVSPPLFVDLDLSSSNPLDVQQLLRDKLVNHRWLCEDLASDISLFANELGFGRDGFVVLTASVTITYTNVVVMSDPPPDEGISSEVIMRTVLLGNIGREKLEGLKMETESCSICLDSLSGSSSKRGSVTRMNCSHVFHGSCLLEWLKRKNTCPMCRTVLYDDFGNKGEIEN